MSTSIVDSIVNYCKANEPEDTYYYFLKNALDDYHDMINKGLLIPRGNTLQNGYSTLYELPRGNCQ